MDFLKISFVRSVNKFYVFPRENAVASALPFVFLRSFFLFFVHVNIPIVIFPKIDYVQIEIK